MKIEAAGVILNCVHRLFAPHSPCRQMLRCFLIVTLVSASLVAAEPERRPNIVVIMADDLGWTDLHCQGNEKLDTPSLDKFATQGMRFTSGYAAAPVCTPTRAAMMTGQSPARLAITNHAPGNGDAFHLEDSTLVEAEWNTYLALEYDTLAERLKRAGYATGFVGKWHLSHKPGKNEKGKLEPQLRPEHQGYDMNIGGCNYGGPPSYFEPYRIPNITPHKDGDYLPDRLADECIGFMERNREKPFFLTWWNYSVHYPFQAPKELIAKYEKRKGRGIPNPAYAAQIEGMDRSIGKLLAAIDEMKLTDNTLVIFKSDNGAFGSDLRPLRGDKGHLYEGGVRVPWMVRWPGVVKPGTICDTPVITMDVFPTVLAAAGVAIGKEEKIDGLDIRPLLEQSADWQRDAIFFHYPNYAFHKRNRLGSAIRMGDFKLIHFYDDSSHELYNLADDIGEKKNLAEAMPEKANMLKGRLLAWLEETGAKLPTRLPQ